MFRSLYLRRSIRTSPKPKAEKTLNPMSNPTSMPHVKAKTIENTNDVLGSSSVEKSRHRSENSFGQNGVTSLVACVESTIQQYGARKAVNLFGASEWKTLPGTWQRKDGFWLYHSVSHTKSFSNCYCYGGPQWSEPTMDAKQKMFFFYFPCVHDSIWSWLLLRYPVMIGSEMVLSTSDSNAGS